LRRSRARTAVRGMPPPLTPPQADAVGGLVAAREAFGAVSQRREQASTSHYIV
jgi:hypothetical protein